MGAIGGWEVGLILFMILLYLVGTWINPMFFGNADALASRAARRGALRRHGRRHVVRHHQSRSRSVGRLDLGLVAVVFSMAVAPSFYDLSPWIGILAGLVVGVGIGLINGVLVSYLRVPAFIATLTMLFIGRGLVLGLTGGQNIGFAAKGSDPFFLLGVNNALGFNNQIILFIIVAIIGGLVLAYTRWGYETYATGGNALASGYAGINTNKVRIRAFVLSSLCATIAGLMNMAQDKGAHSQYGYGAELIVIAAVIIGGASILGGRGRIFGACLGAVLIVLIDKVLREGVPITRTIDVGGTMMEVRAMAQLPPGAVPAFLGLILLAAVLIEPWIIRRRLAGAADRAVARPAAAAGRGGQHRHRVRPHDRHARDGARGYRQLAVAHDGAARGRGDHLCHHIVAHRLSPASGFLGQPGQQLQPAAGLQRDRPDDGRHGLCDARWRCRSLRGLGARAFGGDHGLPDEDDGRAAPGRGADADSPPG